MQELAKQFIIKMNKKQTITAWNGILPCQFQIGERVHLSLMPEDVTLTSFPPLPAFITAVHFLKGNKVKYDLELKFFGDISTRVHNIDSMFVTPKN